MTEAESRTNKRLKVLKTGKIIFNNSLSVMSCTIRDLSDTGAKLIFGETATNLPDDFRLIFTQDNTMRDVKVMWRKGETVGVHFTSEPRRAPARKF
jgi:hypothetical protein